MTTQALRGTIEPLAIVDVLAYLGRGKETGILRVWQDDLEKSIVILDGEIIFARSNRQQDRLGDMLLAKNLITQEQYDAATTLLFEKGYRHGRALVEIGAISPKVLWETIQEQIKSIASSIIPMQQGHFEFIRQALKEGESITLQLPILDLVIDVVRHMDNRAIFKSRFQDGDEVFSKVPNLERYELEPYETYIMQQVNGQASISQICAKSDIGEEESMRVLYLLLSLGLIEVVPRAKFVNDLDDGNLLILKKYNRLFRFIYGYLGQHVGSMGPSLLGKFLVETRKSHAAIFKDVQLRNDGSLDPQVTERNWNALPGDENTKMMMMEEAMEEYLYSGILAIKKMLGPDHESIVLNKIESLS